MIATANDDDQSKSSQVGDNRWTRVREAYRSGELDRQNGVIQSGQKRARRNALGDISTVATNANATSQKQQFHQLVERVRELQKEIVPDVLLYQMPQTYSPFSPITPSSNASRGSISMFPRQHSISISSGSSNSLVSNQRFALSARVLDRAHQIPERFWIDWQQKQMQEQIEELEYIKNNMVDSSSSSLLSNETEENDMEFSTINRGTNYNELRRRSLVFLHEAQRLANERRASLARAATIDASITDKNEETCDLVDRDDHHSFNFDQRSEETADTANLNDLNEDSPIEPITPLPTVPHSPLLVDRSLLTISLPFIYTNTREQMEVPNYRRSIFTEPMLEKVSDDATQINSPTDSIEDVAQINTELNLTTLRREHPKPINPLLYSKATVNHSVEFRKFQPTSSWKETMPAKNDTAIPITVSKSKEIDHSRSSSPTLSFESVRSRFSSFDNGEDLGDGIQTGLVAR